MEGKTESAEDGFSPESFQFKVTKAVFYFIILTASSCGNTLLIYIICSTPSLRKRSSSLFIICLALFDALTPLFSIPFDFALEENGYVWPFGGFLCRVIWPAATLTATCSALTLASISLDRYRLLLHPFKARLTRRGVWLLIVSNIVVGVAVVIPYVTVLDVQDGSCNETWPSEKSRKAYTVVLFLVQYALPLVFMTVMYSLALGHLHSIAGKTWHMRSFKLREADRQNNNKGAKAQGLHRRVSRRLSSMGARNFHVERTNVRATKVFIGIVVIFAIFMLPNQIIWLWSDFGGGQDHPGINQAQIICWLFTYANSVFNPVIFTLFNRDFKRGVVKLTRKLLCIKTTLERRPSGTSCRPHEDATRSSRFSATLESGRLSDVYQISSACWNAPWRVQSNAFSATMESGQLLNGLLSNNCVLKRRRWLRRRCSQLQLQGSSQ